MSFDFSGAFIRGFEGQQERGDRRRDLDLRMAQRKEDVDFRESEQKRLQEQRGQDLEERRRSREANEFNTFGGTFEQVKRGRDLFPGEDVQGPQMWSPADREAVDVYSTWRGRRARATPKPPSLRGDTLSDDNIRSAELELSRYQARELSKMGTPLTPWEQKHKRALRTWLDSQKGISLPEDDASEEQVVPADSSGTPRSFDEIMGGGSMGDFLQRGWAGQPKAPPRTFRKIRGVGD